MAMTNFRSDDMPNGKRTVSEPNTTDDAEPEKRKTRTPAHKAVSPKKTSSRKDDESVPEEAQKPAEVKDAGDSSPADVQAEASTQTANTSREGHEK